MTGEHAGLICVAYLPYYDQYCNGQITQTARSKLYQDGTELPKDIEEVIHWFSPSA